MLFLNYLKFLFIVRLFIVVGDLWVLMGLFINVSVCGVNLFVFVINDMVVSIGIVGWYIEIMCVLGFMCWMNFCI